MICLIDNIPYLCFLINFAGYLFRIIRTFQICFIWKIDYVNQ